jgi:hypothetical protein
MGKRMVVCCHGRIGALRQRLFFFRRFWS